MALRIDVILHQHVVLAVAYFLRHVQIARLKSGLEQQGVVGGGLLSSLEA